MQNISFNSILWLEEILRERINPEIKLSLEGEVHRYWKVSIANYSSFLRIKVIDDLYKLGVQPQLPCGKTKTKNISNYNLDLTLFSPGLDDIACGLIIKKNYGYFLNYDVIGLTYWMLTRSEEVNDNHLHFDSHQRFKFISSHAHQHNYISYPIVDNWLELLKNIILDLQPRIKVLTTNYQLVPTHDVDRPARYCLIPRKILLKRILSSPIVHKDYLSLIKGLYVYMNSKEKINQLDPYNTFNWIMKESEKHGLQSTFNFMCSVTNKSYDVLYDCNNKLIRRLMRDINDRGHLIGLHPSYSSFDKPAVIESEANTLREILKQEEIKQSILGGRMHYLRWTLPNTPQGWELSQCQFDSTVAYSDHIGFRAGTCHSFTMFDPVNQRILKLRQRPLILMECSLISNHYMGLGYTKEAYNMISTIKSRVRKVGGNFTFLWHNSHLLSESDFEMYRFILE